MEKASLPDSLITAMAPTPGGVAIAAMVSSDLVKGDSMAANLTLYGYNALEFVLLRSLILKTPNCNL